MTSIAGVVHLDGAPVEPSLLAPPMRAMARRGGTTPEIVVRGLVGLARHAPADGPAVSRPQLLVRGDLAVVADVRLDGLEELCDALEVPAPTRGRITDAELLLASYERWGSGCPEHLIGDYAFAIWDGTRRTLFCARDHAGARPLYYALVGHRFVFASEIVGVLACAGVPSVIDEAEVARYLLSEARAYFDPVHTFFAHVRKLPFGNRLNVDSAGLRVERYWRPEQLPDVRLPSADDYAERLFSLVDAALTDRLRGARHVGVHLSGGLDSSALAVMASRATRAGRSELTAFSWSPPPTADARGSEHDRIEAVTRAAGIAPVYVPLDVSDCWRFDRDLALTPWVFPMAERTVSRAAAAAGVDVMVSGWGGDEGASYSARGIPAAYLASGRWRALAAYCHDRATRTGVTPRLRAAASIAWRDACVPWLPRPVFRRLSPRIRRQVPPVIAADFLLRIRPFLRPPIDVDRDIPGGRANMLRLYDSGIISGRLESWGALRDEWGLTYVYPLADRRILEFIYGAPPTLHLERGLTRCLFRRAMASVLPAEWIRTSTKREEGRFGMIERYSSDRERTSALERLAAPGVPSPHPWVDVERLRAAVLGASGQLLLPPAAEHGLAALTTWQNWCGGAVARPG